MAKSLNTQEEAFARAMAAGKGPSASYREAYQSKMGAKAIAANAKRLLKRPHVRARIEELQKESGESADSADPTGAPQPAPSETELRVKQERFLQLFLEKGNASEAYRQAYDVSPGTKPETIHRCAAELLVNPKVTTRLEQLRAELRERNAITLDHLVEALRPIAFSDIRKVVTWGQAIPLKDPETGEVLVVQDVIVKPADEIDDAAAAMISKVIRSKDGTVRVELHDKLAAVEKLAKLMGHVKEQHEVKVVTPPEPKAPPKDVLEKWAAKYLGAIEKHRPSKGGEQRREGPLIDRRPRSKDAP